MTIENAPFYTEALQVGDRVAAVYPNHRWGLGVIVEVRTEPGQKPYVVQSDRSGELGYFMADGIVREVPSEQYAARKAWRDPSMGAGEAARVDLIARLDSVASFLSDDDEHAAEYDAVVEARKRIAAGL